MRKSGLILFLILFLAALAPAQTTTFNGVIKDLSNTPIPTGQVTFALKPSVDTTISGQGRFVPSTTFCEIHNPAITSTSGTGTITVNVGTAQTWQVGDSLIFVGTADATLNGSSVATPYTITLVNSTTSFNFTQSGTHTNGAGGTVGGLYKSGGTGPCSVMQSSAITPANTYYSVSLWPIFSLTSSFNTYAIGSGPVDISTVVPTPGQQPAYSFVDLFTNQTITGIKTFSNGIIFNGGISSAGPNNLAGGGTLGGTFNCTIVNAVRCISPANPQGWAGSDLGAWINAAQANCSGSCVIQVASGTYTLSTAASIGNIGGTNKVTLQLGAVTVTASAAITIYPSSALQGPPAGLATGSISPSAIIKQANSANLNAVVQCGDGTNNGNDCVVQDLLIDGNLANNPSTNYLLLANKSSRFEWNRVSPINSASHGFGVISSTSGNESCCGNISHVISQNNSGSGLFIKDTSDVSVTGPRSEFGNNSRYGVECQSCGGLSFIGQDASANLLGGLLLGVDPSSIFTQSNTHIVGNRLVGNNGHAIAVVGQANGYIGTVIALNNISTGTLTTNNTYDAINLLGTNGNTVIGNHIIENSSHTWRYGVNVLAGTSGDNWNLVSGNIFDTGGGTFGTGLFSGTTLTQFEGNVEGATGISRFTNPYFTNATNLKWLDASGAAQNVLFLDASNNVFITGHPVQKTINLQPLGGGSTRFSLTDTLATFSVPLASPTLNTPTLSGVTNATGLQLFNTTTTCTTGASIGAICTTGAITLPVAYADTNYRLSCTGQGATNVPIVQTYAKSNTTFTITIAALTAVAATFTSYDCSAVHN